MRNEIIIAGLVCVLGYSCTPLKPQDKDAKSHDLSGAYSGEIKQGSALVISSNSVVAVKQLPKSLNQSADDLALAEFQNGLYGKLRDNCFAGCHDSEAKIPLASPGIEVAWLTVKSKGYVTEDPEASVLVVDIRASHKGVDAALADEVVPMIKAIWEKLSAAAE